MNAECSRQAIGRQAGICPLSQLVRSYGTTAQPPAGLKQDHCEITALRSPTILAVGVAKETHYDVFVAVAPALVRDLPVRFLDAARGFLTPRRLGMRE